jgi:hypothetical protein
MGFNDAEGNFQIYPKKRVTIKGEISKYNVGYGYHLSLHKRDCKLLMEIRKILNGVGVLYEYKDKLDSRLAVNDIKGLLYLINNIFHLYPLKTKNQLIRFFLLKDALINKVKEFKTLEEFHDYKTLRLKISGDKADKVLNLLNRELLLPVFDGSIVLGLDH